MNALETLKKRLNDIDLFLCKQITIDVIDELTSEVVDWNEIESALQIETLASYSYQISNILEVIDRQYSDDMQILTAVNKCIEAVIAENPLPR